MWLGILLLISLAAFIVWDSRRLRNGKVKPLAREAMVRGFLPTGPIAWQTNLGIGGLSALTAFIEWEEPSKPPFTGRWSWLYQAIFEAFGTRGLFSCWTSVAVLFLLFGVLLWRRQTAGAQGSSGQPVN